MIVVAKTRPDQRAEFIQKTYAHLAAAIGGFIVVEFFLFTTGIAEGFFNLLIATGMIGGFALIAIFSLVGWYARELATKTESINQQYMGLGLYAVAQAVFFAPLLYMAATFYDPTVIPTAGILTLLLFGGLTLVAFTTKKDFTFLGGILKIGGFVAIGVIICSAIFGFPLGLLFSSIMVVFASAAILYDTSKVMRHYRTDQYVAASLELFASVALLFLYILRIVMALSSRE
ncbi:Bax inhibitor-1 family protein [Spirulina major CS-329]|uniref:Bax inhibitor-1/YccA family protein n=1 Tax=Spirulina TaxID=1154 RepID=UPI00232D2750|nr:MULTISPECIES: Bax inhibitor-1 family protein [Spirulina]MDB9495620.1 Bax inhibitor-1 family protein [Spirulina subsalsa CS-330]MDB9503513.1 Bax inhibitor-1 family protein [Spirulina major CS-329]